MYSKTKPFYKQTCTNALWQIWISNQIVFAHNTEGKFAASLQLTLSKYCSTVISLCPFKADFQLCVSEFKWRFVHPEKD